MQELEYVVDAEDQFDIGTFGVHHRTPIWELHEDGVMGVLSKGGVILVRKLSPQALDPNELTPLQLLQQRDTIEDLPVHVPRSVQRRITVVEKLHVIDHVERLILNDVR